MFFRSDDDSQQTKAAAPTPIPTLTQPAPARTRTRDERVSVISADIRIVGDLEGEGELQIDGTVEGNIKSKTVTIGQSGVINGEIKADTVLIAGQFAGKIKSRVLTLTKTAHVDGNVAAQESLAIEAGAHFEGQCLRPNAKQGNVKEHDGKFAEIKKQLGAAPVQPDLKKAATG